MDVLIIDDEPAYVRTLSDRMGKRGIFPRTAESGEAGLALLATHPVDVVVLDVRLQGMNGHEVLRLIKKSRPEVEVIFLTGHGTTADGVAGIKAGAFDYLSKPVEFEHLLEKIKQAYEKKVRVAEQQKEAAFRENINKQLIVAERLAALGTLCTGVAHEINNPLAIIQEWSQRMKAMADAPEKWHQYREEFSLGCDKIMSAVGRAKRITHQLLDMVQKRAETVMEISAAGLVREVMQLTDREARNNQIAVDGPTDDTHIVFTCDPYPLRQVLLNLMTNALHATPAGGAIAWRVGADAKHVLFTITDSGVGIAPENLDRIFDPFFTTKPTGQGTGLGLYLSRRIVENLGGTITVDSTVGRGATFRVRLPLQPPPCSPVCRTNHQPPWDQQAQGVQE